MSASVDSWSTTYWSVVQEYKCLPVRAPKADLAAPVTPRGKPSSGFWFLVYAYLDPKEKLDSVFILSSEDGRHPFPRFPVGRTCIWAWFCIFPKCLVLSVCPLLSALFFGFTFLCQSLFCFTLRDHKTSFFSFPYTSRLCFAIFQRVPKEGQHFRRYSLPSDDASSASWARLMEQRGLGPANQLSGSFPISSPTGYPWSNNLSMSVGLSVVLFSCLVVALCFIFKKKKSSSFQRLTSRLCYWRAAAPLSRASPLPRAAVWSNSMTVCDYRVQQLDL